MTTRKFRKENEAFHSFLRQQGLKRTYQKDLILETFLNAEGHLSVEDIYAAVKKRDKKVGIVTVFRTLKSLTACGIAREISLGDGLTRFEHGCHHPSHHHIICSECHKAIEFACPELERIQNEILQKYHFHPVHYQFNTFGVCSDCYDHHPARENSEYDAEKLFARDVIIMAVFMETRHLEFYQGTAKRNQDPGGREAFERMAFDKESCISGLNAKMEELFNQEKGLDGAPVFLHFNPYEIESLIPNLSKYEIGGVLRLDGKSAMESALALERSSADYFQAYANKFAETQGRQILLSFAAEQANYCGLLRRRIEAMPESNLH